MTAKGSSESGRRRGAHRARARGSTPRDDLLTLLVDTVSDYAIFALDPAGHVLTWNAGAVRFKGYAADEIIGRHFSAFYPPEDVAARKPERELEIATRLGRYEEEGWRIRKDGSRFWANVVITALRDADGQLVGFATITRDLTARRAAEEALRESEERFRLLVEGVRDYAIFMLDPGGHVVSWNLGAQLLKGYLPAEIIGRHFSAFYPAEDIAAEKPKRELEVASRTGTYEEEGWRIRKDGTAFWANVLITALRNTRGELIGYAKVTRDLTERRASQERALADTRRIAEAEASSRTKTEFLTAMSHELRTPINAALGYAELLALQIGGPMTTQQQEYVTRIRESQEHLLAIINDLLNYGRVESGQLRYEIADVPLNQLIAKVIPMVTPQATAKGITLTVVPSPERQIVRADRMRAEQIVLNLLSNAVKFTPAGGRVTTRVTRAAPFGRVTVEDTGPGIPAEMQEAIFAPFVQLGRSLTSGHEGTGLGLSISRDLARAMGGEVTVESGAGEGSCFTMALPMA